EQREVHHVLENLGDRLDAPEAHEGTVSQHRPHGVRAGDGSLRLCHGAVGVSDTPAASGGAEGPREMNAFRRRSSSRRGKRTRLPQVWQTSPMSAPMRTTFHSYEPHG